MDEWRVVEIVLVSIVAGALLPAILQLRATLRTVQQRLVGTADRVDRALERIGTALDRLDRATEPLDDGRRVREVMDAVESLAATVNQLRRSAQVATAVGAAVAPAVAAAVRAMRAPAAPEAERPEAAADEVEPAPVRAAKAAGG